jgi:hypothetical protein
MHRRAIPNACWVLRLHVFDLYSERSQFAMHNGSDVHGPYKAVPSNNGVRMGNRIAPLKRFKLIIQ